MSTGQIVRWALFAWIGGSLSIIPLLAVAGWAMHTKAKLRARSRRNHPAERARQRQSHCPHPRQRQPRHRPRPGRDVPRPRAGLRRLATPPRGPRRLRLEAGRRMTATATETQQGVFTMPEELYHRHRALSFSGVKKLLPPSCPAIFKWERDNPPDPTAAMEHGTAAHALVLGTGPELVRIDADDWRKNDTKALAKEARDRGAVPLLAKQHDQVIGMATALRAHPVARLLLDPERGKPEQSLFWRDPEFGVLRRSRLDWLPDPVDDGRLFIIDYKTSKSAEPSTFSRRAMYDYGYDVQAAFYLDGATTLELAERPIFLFIIQEPTPPYVVTIAQPDLETLRIGAYKVRQALETYCRCVAEDRWPGYTDDVAVLSPPPWISRDYEGLI